MPIDAWPTVRLGDLARIEHGWPFKSEHFSEELTGRPIVVAIGNFEYTGGFRFESTSVKEYRGEYPSRYELAPDDVLVVMTCQTPGGEILGIPARVPNDGRVYLHNQRIGKVVVTRPDLVTADFLYWVFLWTELNQELVASSSGTKIVHTAPSRIEAFRFCLPPLNEQRRIAELLGALESKRHVHRRMSRALEGVATALFRAWFVDFDPVTAKADGKRAIGVSDRAYEVMPSRFVESAEGPLPEGWRWGVVGEEFGVVMGQSPPGTSYNETGDGVPFYQGCTDFGFRYPARRLYTNAPSRFAREDDTLVSVRAPVGRVNMAGERCCIGRGLAAVRHRSGSRAFTYYAMRALDEQFSVFEGEGTLFGAITRDGFAQLPIVVPSEDVVRAFEQCVGPMDEHIKVNERQDRDLTALRATLLPQLLSGSIRLRAAEDAIALTL